MSGRRTLRRVFVTFLSDFGLQDDFVGTCHGVIKRIASEAEVIDIQVLRPLDVTPISESVRRTSILVTVEEQAPTGGWSSDVVADVVSQAFDYLDAPPARVTLPDHPLPYSPELEDALIPSPERIAARVKSLLRETGRTL